MKRFRLRQGLSVSDVRQIVFVVIGMACVSSAVYADTTPIVQPSFFDPGRLSKLLQTRPVLPPPTSAPLVPHQNLSKTQESEKKLHFILTKVIFSGNTIYSDDELNAIFQSSLHKRISVFDLQTLVNEITIKYRAAGYIISRAFLPPQTITGGIVHVEVVEGFVHQVTINDKAGRLAPRLTLYGNHIQQSRPLQEKVLEHYLLLANDLPGAKVTAVLTPAKDTPGAADVVLTSDERRATGSISYDNFGTRYIGPNEVTASGTIYSLLSPGDSTTAQFVATTEVFHELQFGELLHTQPIGSHGLNLTVMANYNETRPDFVLEPLNIVARSVTGVADLSYPIVRSRSDNVFVHGGVNYTNVTSTILGGPFYQDRMRSMMIGGVYNSLDRWSGLNTVGLDLEHSFPIFGAHDHFFMSRPQGESVYTRGMFQASRLQVLSSRFSLLAAMHGQYTHDPLLTTVQFGFGGPDYGRGYDVSEILGDKGLAGKLELRLDTAPQFRFLQSVQFYGFYDAGIIWNIDNVDLPGRQTGTSTGAGMRMTFMPQITGNFYVAKPLTLPVGTMLILGHNAFQPRTYFQITVSL